MNMSRDELEAALASARQERDEAVEWSYPRVVKVNEELRALYEASLQRETQLREALQAIAEGNLGDMPWQANLARVSEFASVVLADTSPPTLTGEEHVATSGT